MNEDEHELTSTTIKVLKGTMSGAGIRETNLTVEQRVAVVR